MYTSKEMIETLHPVLWKLFRESTYPEPEFMHGAILDYLGVPDFNVLRG